MKLLKTASLLLAGMMSASAMAGDHGGKKSHDFYGPGFSGHSPTGMMLSHIDLTGDQKREIKSIFQRFKPSAEEKKSRRAERKAMHQQHHALVTSEVLDLAAVHEFAQRRAELVKQNLIKQTEIMHQVWKVLTPDQQQEMKNKMNKRMDRMKKRMKKGRRMHHDDDRYEHDDDND